MALSRAIGISPPRKLSPPVFQKQVDEVHLRLTVTDRRGRSVTNLTPNDITVLDDHKPARAITQFRQDGEAGLRVGILLDWSGSVQQRCSWQRELAIAFLRQSLRPRYDEGFVIGFSNRVELTQALSDDPEALVAGVRPAGDGYLTALYDAIQLACRVQMERSKGDRPWRRILLVWSDGEDNLSRASLAEAMVDAQRAEVMIYAIVPQRRRSRDSRGYEVLMQLADATGGRAFLVRNREAVAQALNAIAQDIRAQYALWYKPTEPSGGGRYHSIEIIPHDKTLQVRARRGYFAGTD